MTTCPNCGAPGQIRTMIGPEMKAVKRMRYLCGSTDLEGKDWPTAMCEHAETLRRERDEARAELERMRPVVESIENMIEARAFGSIASISAAADEVEELMDAYLAAQEGA